MIKYPTYFIHTGNVAHPILKAKCYLLNKYWKKENQKFVILGFQKPTFELPENFEFVSMAPNQEGGADRFCNYICDYFDSINDDHIIFDLDDFLPLDYLNTEIFEDLLSIAKTDESVAKIYMGHYPGNREEHKIIKTSEHYDVYSQKCSAPYTLSLITSVWKRSYFVNYLKNAVNSGNANPWAFELMSPTTSGDKSKRIGTHRKHCWKFHHGSALSAKFKNKINVLGMKIPDIKELEAQNFIVGDEYMFGWWPECLTYPVGSSLEDFNFKKLESTFEGACEGDINNPDILAWLEHYK
jgi:hypothetical protein